jgi:hypothetical protein
MNPIEQPYTVGLTKYIFMEQCIMQNCKKPNTKIFIYKYIHLKIL